MTLESYKPKSVDEVAILDLYYSLLKSWNKQDAHEFAHLFSGTACVIGFDGSHMFGQSDVEAELKQIFENHRTGTYVFKLRDIRHLDTHCLLLSAVAGMIPAGGSEIDPTKNVVQSLVAIKKNDTWYIELFQNTPVQFHGRPEMAEALTNELKELSAGSSNVLTD